MDSCRATLQDFHSFKARYSVTSSIRLPSLVRMKLSACCPNDVPLLRKLRHNTYMHSRFAAGLFGASLLLAPIFVSADQDSPPPPPPPLPGTVSVTAFNSYATTSIGVATTTVMLGEASDGSGVTFSISLGGEP